MLDRLLYKDKIYCIHQFENNLTDYFLDKDNNLCYNKYRYELNSDGFKEYVFRENIIFKFTGTIKVTNKIKLKFIKGKLMRIRNG